MGTPEFAVPSLDILLTNGYSVPAVVTAPDKPRGRGRRLLPTAVKEFALRHNLQVFQPESLRDESFIEAVKQCSPDLIVVVAFRVLPKELFTIPRFGAINLHASLLPKYRGAAPINWAIINGETETGVTTFFLQEKVDTGNVILQARTTILPEDNAGTIHDKLSLIGAEVVLHTVRLIEQGKAVTRKQDDAAATPAPKIFKEQCRMNWNRSAEELHNFVRGLSPYPAAVTTIRGMGLKIFKTAVMNESASRGPGEIEIRGAALLVGTQDRWLSILELQPEGRKRMTAEEFLRGYPVFSGESCG